MKKLPDIQQSQQGFYKLPINKVGVRNIKIPLELKLKNSSDIFHTIANISSYCNLVDDIKGINMSRISRTINSVILNNSMGGVDNLVVFAKELQQAHDTDDIYIKAEFDYIYRTKTPVTQIDSLEPVHIIFETTLLGDELHNYVTVKTTEMSLCPCSKEMSLLMNNLTDDEKEELDNAQLSKELSFKLNNAGFGAHNQKSIIEVKIELNKNPDFVMWIEDLVHIIKLGSSCPTWSTLKRPDEKYVTEVSYMGGYYDENLKYKEVRGAGPKFVEDIARDIANNLNFYLGHHVMDYVVVVNNQESIHSDDIMATAVLSAGINLK